MPSAMGLLEERERVTLARAEELRVELERPGAVVCRPLDRIPEVHHPLGGGEAVIPDALFTTNATLPIARTTRTARPTWTAQAARTGATRTKPMPGAG